MMKMIRNFFTTPQRFAIGLLLFLGALTPLVSVASNHFFNPGGKFLNVTCSVSPTSISQGGSATWTAYPEGGSGGYTYSWSGTDSLSGSTQSVTKVYTNAGTKTASVTIFSGGQSATATCFPNLTVTTPQADLIISGMTPTTAIQNQSTPVYMTIQNIGGTTASNFPNFMWADKDNDWAYDAPADAIWSGTISSLAGGGTSVTVSTNFTFTEARVYVVGGCADNTSTWGAPAVPESNNGNNCFAHTVTVNPPLSASCSVSPTSIYTGQSATWGVSASGGTGSYTYSWSGTDSLVGSSQSVSKVYSSAGTKYGAVTVTSGSQVSTVSCSNSVSVTVQQIPDLIATSISPSDATAGTPTTFSATIYNTGNATASASNTLFQRATSSGGANTTTIGTASTAAINASGNRTVSVSHTLPYEGAWYIRACADTNGSVTESNEGNNCSAWTAVSAAAACFQDGYIINYEGGGCTPRYDVALYEEPRCCSGLAATGGQYGCNSICVDNLWSFPPPEASISASPTTVVIGQSATISWSSLNADSCVGTNFSTGGGLNGSTTVTPSNTTTYTVTCTNPSGAASASVTVTVQKPDLSTSTISPTTATAGVSQTFSATVSNGGNATAGSSNTLFQRATSSGGANATTIGTVSTASINAGSSRTVSLAYTLPSQGTWYIRACADSSSAVAESNEGNNCGLWTAITTGYPPLTSVSCTVSPTAIYTNQSAVWSASASGGSGSYTYSWSGTDSLAGSSVSVSKIYSVVGIKTGSVTVSSGGYSQTVSCSNSVSVTVEPKPDLSTSTISPTTATAGVSQTFSATVSNGGNATAGSSNTLFQRATSSGGANATTIGTVSTASINAGSSRTVSLAYTLPSQGTWYIRACADTGSAITESNEGNNCGSWTAITTAYPPLSGVSCSASPTSIYTNQSATWTASASGGSGSYTYSWSGTDSLVGSTPSVSKYYASTGTKTASVTVSSGGYSQTVSCSNSVSVLGWPDLIAVGVAPDNATAFVEVTISTTVYNEGTASAGTSNTTFFIDNNTNHAAIHSTRTVSTNSITNGSNRTVQSTFTFPNNGTWYIRACADQNASETGTITESSESNNCTSWESVTVDPYPTPNITSFTAVPSSIDNGSSSLLSWTVQNADSCSGTNFSTGGQVSSGSATVSPSTSTTYTLTCTGLGGSDSDSETVTVVNRADLIINPNQIQVPELIQATVPIAVQATVENDGTASTGSSFTNTLFIDNNPGHGSIYGTESRSMSAITAGSTRLFEASYTFPTQGTWYLRVCADQNGSGAGTIIEFIESNNCTPWTAVTVAEEPPPPPPEAVMSIGANPTVVGPLGTSTISWSAENIVSGSCRVNGSNGQSVNPASTPTGSFQMTPIETPATFTLTCTDLYDETQTVSVTVTLVPEFQEI